LASVGSTGGRRWSTAALVASLTGAFAGLTCVTGTKGFCGFTSAGAALSLAAARSLAGPLLVDRESSARLFFATFGAGFAAATFGAGFAAGGFGAGFTAIGSALRGGGAGRCGGAGGRLAGSSGGDGADGFTFSLARAGLTISHTTG